MINLIPNQEQKKMKKDFYLRLVVMLILALSVSLFIASVSILPSYFASMVSRNLATAKLETQKSSEVAVLDTSALKEVEFIDKQLKLIEGLNKNKFVFSERVLKKIILSKTPDIKIEKFLFDDDTKGNKRVVINGQASSREKLLEFRTALERDKTFTGIDLPISNFIKGSDIEFSLQLKVIDR